MFGWLWFRAEQYERRSQEQQCEDNFLHGTPFLRGPTGQVGLTLDYAKTSAGWGQTIFVSKYANRPRRFCRASGTFLDRVGLTNTGTRTEG
jgi:hypothetical protein